MTVRQYVEAVMRRWYVLALVLVCAAGGIAALPRHAAVYWGHADVVFLSPSNTRVPSNVLDTFDESVIYFAAAVERMVDAGHGGAVLASPDATLYGTGARHGFTIRLYNSGGQWVSNFERPMLSVQAVGTSQQEAQDTLAAVVSEIQDVARGQQVAAGAGEASMITTEVSPGQLSVVRLGGSWARGAAVLGLLGLVIASALSVIVDNARGGGGPVGSAGQGSTVRLLGVRLWSSRPRPSAQPGGQP